MRTVSTIGSNTYFQGWICTTAISTGPVATAVSTGPVQHITTAGLDLDLDRDLSDV